MPDITIINPEAMGPPLSLYGQIARVRASEFIFIAGQLATDAEWQHCRERRFRCTDEAGFVEHREGAKVGRGVVRKCRAIYNLSGPLAGHREFPARPRRFVPRDIPGAPLSTQHASCSRSSGSRRFSHRNRDDRGTLTPRPPGFSGWPGQSSKHVAALLPPSAGGRYAEAQLVT